MGFAVVVGVFGLVGVHPTEGRADAATAAPVLDLPVPPRVLMTTEDDPPATTTTTTPVETTTTTIAPPAVETTTTTAAPPPPPTTTTTAPPRPKVASSGPDAMAQIEAIANASGWNWRAAGVRFMAAYNPSACCHWGVYERDTGIVWVGPSAFGDQNRLRYVVLHELAHAWQYRQDKFREIIADYSRWGFSSIGPALEAGADCLADVWGALRSHYWNCPADAQALAARRLGGDWR